MAFGTFTMLCNHHLYSVPEHFYHHRKDPVPIKQLLLTLPFPQPLATTNLCSVSMDLPILDISYKQNHKICDLLCLASFT